MEIKVELPVVRVSTPLMAVSLSPNTSRHSLPRKCCYPKLQPRPHLTTSCFLSPKSQGGKSPISIRSLSPFNKLGKKVDWRGEAIRLWKTREMAPITQLRTKLLNTRQRLPRLKQEEKSFARLFSVYKLRKTEISLVGQRLDRPKLKEPQLHGWETPVWEGTALL